MLLFTIIYVSVYFIKKNLLFVIDAENRGLMANAAMGMFSGTFAAILMVVMGGG